MVADRFGVRVAGKEVEAWSVTRLPFEPEGWLLDYRTALRSALRSVAPVEGFGLAARYYAPDESHADVENVLCYNLGSGCYAQLIGGGLRLNRDRSHDELHRMNYRLAPIGSVTGPPLATVTTAVPDGMHSAGQWWALLRPTVVTSAPTRVSTFGVEVQISGTWTNAGLAGAIKPMLDGLISALHAHDQSQALELIPRLAVLGDPASAWSLLCDESKAILGKRRLLRTNGPAGFAWNPADDLCTEINVVRSPGHARTIRAAIYATDTARARSVQLGSGTQREGVRKG
jgi:hypothetical protein